MKSLKSGNIEPGGPGMVTSTLGKSLLICSKFDIEYEILFLIFPTQMIDKMDSSQFPLSKLVAHLCKEEHYEVIQSIKSG